MEKKIKILYLHGFEETPVSPKPMLLKAEEDFEVKYVDLNVYLTKKNGPLRHIITHKRTLLSIGASAVSYAMGVPLVAAGIVGGAALYVQKDEIRSGGIINSVEATYKIAIEALENYKPDIVVGFSWGGCLASMLLHSKRWNGPTVLLAPAYEKLLKIGIGNSKRTKIKVFNDNFDLSKQLVDDVTIQNHIKIVVGTKEQILSYNNIIKFADKSNIEVISVENGYHNLWNFDDLPSLIRSLLNK